MDADGASEQDSNPQPAAGPAETVASLAGRVRALEQQLAVIQQQVTDLRHALTASTLSSRRNDPQLPPVQEAVPPAPPASSPSSAPPASGSRPALSAAPPPPPFPPLQPPPAEPAAAKSLEERFGSQLFNLIGIAALIIAASLALKLAIDKGLVGPAARVLLGILVGAGTVLWSERFRHRGLNPFSWSLKAIGSGVLYLTLWAAFQLFHLLPAAAALATMLLVTAWNAFMAWSQDAELLAAYALAGGFATPLLLASGGNHEVFLFTYIAALDLALVLLLRTRPWYRLLLPALAATALYFLGWYGSFFRHVDRVGVHNVASDTVILDRLFWQTTAFILVFAAIFAVVSVRGFLEPRGQSLRTELLHTNADVIVVVLVPLANAAFLSLALYSVFLGSGLKTSLAWLMVALAALYLGLLRVQASSASRAVHLACAIVFLTVAVPLKAHGHTLTAAWLIEGLVLYWVSGRLDASTLEDRASHRVLDVLSISGYLLGLTALVFFFTLGSLSFAGTPPDLFFTASLGAALIAVASVGGAGYLAARREHASRSFAAQLALLLIALLLVLGELTGAIHPAHAFAHAAFFRALLGLALLAATAWWARRLAGSFRNSGFLRLAAASAVAANLVALLLGVHELTSLFGSQTASTDAELQRSLAISAWLMAYGAILLTAGFLRRSAFTRWQALILILFTILKVFLYDLSALSQGYRIVSIFALGALLMAVSLAYQRDWLGLRAQRPAGAGLEAAVDDVEPR